MKVFLTILFSASLVPSLAPADESRPNVILVITDDQGYGDLGCHGNRMIRTPNLDRLHGASVRLTDFHVSPCCTPTRAALMTGRDCVRVGAWGTTWGRSMPRAEEVLMPAFFKESGYRTAMFGKWHLGDSYPFRPRDRGFEHVVCHGGGGVGQTPDHWGNDYFDDIYFHNGKPVKHSGYCTDVWFEEALRFIEQNRDHPFFVYLSTNAPHGPLNVAAKYSDPYVQQGVLPNMAKFYGMIENIDENMGKLMNRLEQLQLAQNTLLIFMTDNGTANGISKKPARTIKTGNPGNDAWKGFNAGMSGKKGSLLDGGHRVPCFLRWPAGGLTGGRDLAGLTAHLDLLPTLIDLCGLKKREGVRIDGISLTPLLRGRMAALPGRSIIVQFRQSHEPPEKWKGAVLSARWRLLDGKKLFDIQSDSLQARDVASANGPVVERLRDAYEAWWTEVSSGFDRPSRIVIGAPDQGSVSLTAFDWHTRTPWNQGHVRSGTAANGFWAIDVARAGRYRIALRRWPTELDMALEDAPEGGKRLSIAGARLRIGGREMEKTAEAGDVAVIFDLDLEAGPTELWSWLIDNSGKANRGAYYAYVTRL